MKQCPVCKQPFSDDNDFCVSDGMQLVSQPYPVPSSSDVETKFIPVSQYAVAPAAPANGRSFWWAFPVIGVLCGLVVVLGFLVLDRERSPNGRAVYQSAPESTDSKGSRETPQTRQPSATPVSQAEQNQPGNVVVTVDSPRDGFLALKSEPCVAPCGTLLAKIPHGTRLSLGDCRDTLEVADRRRGRWCSTSYRGQSGWIFDGFVIR